METDQALKFHPTQNIWYELDNLLVPVVKDNREPSSSISLSTDNSELLRGIIYHVLSRGPGGKRQSALKKIKDPGGSSIHAEP